MLSFEYFFDDPATLERVDLKIDIDDETLLYVPASQVELPDWTALEFNKCDNCPLSKTDFERCPIAANISPIVEKFQHRISYDPVVCTVRGPERTYSKTLPIQNGLCAAIGLVMATSPCPYMTFLRPLARFHLPFASPIETLMRVVSVSLLRQHLEENGAPAVRLDLAQITNAYRDVNHVNRGIARRIQSFATGDAGANAVVNWHSVANLLLRGCAQELNELRTLIAGSAGRAAFFDAAPSAQPGKNPG